MRELGHSFSIVNRLTELRARGLEAPAPLGLDGQRRVALLFAVLIASATPCLIAEHHGYTWSLLMFAAPSAAIVLVYRRSAWLTQARRPLLTALGLLAPMGALLNLTFADRFFVYPNPDAVVGLYLRGVAWRGEGVAIPAEEFAFYALGFLSLMLLYLWARNELFSAPLEQPISVVRPRPLQAAVTSLALVLAVCALEWLSGRRGVPEYLGYLLLVPLPATLAWLPVVRPRLHWGAVALTMLALLLVSVTWEVSLAIPGGWWGYQRGAMAGLFVSRWNGLPIEAIAVWFLSSLSAVVTLEWSMNRHSRMRGGSARRRAPASARR